MDLRSTIASTLSANASTRQQAELALKAAEAQSGFIEQLLQLVEREQDAGVRLSAVVYLKNRVSRGWNTEHTVHPPIPEQDRSPFKGRLLPVLANSPPQIRAQLVALLQTILQNDFPKKWPEFMDITLQLLNSTQHNEVFAGLQCLMAVCRAYRFTNGNERSNLDRIVEVSFPRILTIGGSLVDETSLEAAEMLRLVVKCYKHAVYYELPKPLQAHQSTVGWCTLFLRVITKEPPASCMLDDIEEREQTHWWKSRKWSYANLNRLFVRYGNPNGLTTDSQKEYNLFSKSFIQNFAPEILKGYLEEIEKWVGGNHWLSRPSLSYTLIFLEECVKPEATYKLLSPHIDNLIRHLIFPVLCQTDEELEMFTEEPSEYLHRKLNYYEELSAPDMAATNFLIALTKSRKSQTFKVLQFVNEVVMRYEAAPDDQKIPREKEGALRMIGSLAPVVLKKNSPIKNQIEYFFVRYVFPEFSSPHGFLRARACNTLEKYEELDFEDQNNLLLIYSSILKCMADDQLPVRVMASLALQPLIRHQVIRSAMEANIPQIMHQLLKLANEVDVDALANVMEDFVEVFSEQLTPFAVALSEQLRDTYLRIIRELLEKNEAKAQANGDTADVGEYLDDKSIAALGVLQTIGTLILTLEASADVLLHLETILMPIITVTLENKLYDLYNEIFEIIDSCTFASKQISPTMWQAFELMHKTFKEGAELYLEDMLPALNNFVAFGKDRLMQHPPYLTALVGMVEDIFHDPKVGGVDRICGCKLAEALMLHLPGGPMNPFLPKFIALPMQKLIEQKNPIKSYKIHLLEMVINAIYYNVQLALAYLEQNGWTNKFFSLWFGGIELLRRVHDKKLCIAAISVLLTIPANEIPPSVQTGWPRLLTGATYMFKTLPAAEKRREEAARQNESGDYDDESGEYEDDSAEDWTEEETKAWTEPLNSSSGLPADSQGDVKDEANAYLEFLSKEAQKFGSIGESDEDSVLDESNFFESPLDKFDPYVAFRSAMEVVQQNNPQLMTTLTTILDANDREFLQRILQPPAMHS